MKIKYLIIGSLTILLSSSSFYFAPYFSALIHNEALSVQQVNFGLNNHHYDVAKYHLEYLPKGSRQRKELLLALAEHEPSFWLVLAEEEQWNDSFEQERSQYVQGIAEPVVDSITPNITKQMINYWTKASLAGLQESNIYLAQYYLSLEQFSLAYKWLDDVNESKLLMRVDYQLTQAKLLLALGKVDSLQAVSDRQYNTAELNQFYKDLARFNVFKDSRNSQHNEIAPVKAIKQCLADITLFASNYKDLKRWQQIERGFQTHPLNNFLCINTIEYKPKQFFDCQYGRDKPLICEESQWLSVKDEVTSRFIGVMLPEGTANVHYGILYLDRADDVDVFAHEVAHLFGFIDEYALSKSHRICQSSGIKGHNLVVLDSTSKGLKLTNKEFLSQVKNSPWALQHPQKGKAKANNQESELPSNFYPAETCDNNPKLQAYKPLYEFTALRSYSADFPPLYHELLKKSGEKFLMPSFHYNIAYALHQQGNIELAKDLLAQASLYFDSELLKAKTRRGEF